MKTCQAAHFSVTLCVSHAMPFWRNRLPYWMLQPLRAHTAWENVAFKVPKIVKSMWKKSLLCPFTGVCCPFFVTARIPLFHWISPVRFFINITSDKRWQISIYELNKTTGSVESGLFKCKKIYWKPIYRMQLKLSIKYDFIRYFSCFFLSWVYIFTFTSQTIKQSIRRFRINQ